MFSEKDDKHKQEEFDNGLLLLVKTKVMNDRNSKQLSLLKEKLEEKLSTNRTPLLNELKTIKSLDTFKTRIKELCSNDHGQGSNWKPGFIFGGSRLRKKLVSMLTFMSHITPVTIDQLPEEKIKKQISLFSDVIQSALNKNIAIRADDGEFKHLRKTDPVTFNTVFEELQKKTFAIRIKELLEPFYQYFDDKPNNSKYGALTQRVKDIGTIKPQQLANLFYYELGMLISIEQFRYGNLQKIENTQLRTALDFICDKLNITIEEFKQNVASESDERAPHGAMRFLNAFSPELNPPIKLLFPKSLKNKKMISALHSIYFNAFTSFSSNPHQTIQERLHHFSEELFNLMSYSPAISISAEMKLDKTPARRYSR
jgi:hypothetical protein